MSKKVRVITPHNASIAIYNNNLIRKYMQTKKMFIYWLKWKKATIKLHLMLY